MRYERLITVLIFLPIITSAAVSIVAYHFMATAQEQKRWEQFSAEHNCKPDRTVFGATASGPGGSVVASRHSSTVYLCDDGNLYVRYP